MKDAFYFIPVQETIYILLHFWIIVLHVLLDIHYGDIRSQNGTVSQELATQQSQDFKMKDSDQDSSSEFSATEDSAVDSPIAKRTALARVATNAVS